MQYAGCPRQKAPYWNFRFWTVTTVLDHFGEVIQAMPKRKHSFSVKVFPYQMDAGRLRWSIVFVLDALSFCLDITAMLLVQTLLLHLRLFQSFSQDSVAFREFLKVQANPLFYVEVHHCFNFQLQSGYDYQYQVLEYRVEEIFANLLDLWDSEFRD